MKAAVVISCFERKYLRSIHASKNVSIHKTVLPQKCGTVEKN